VARGENSRKKIMDVAQDSVLAKGFDATSIDEIVAQVEITKSGFFYHFRDKNALAKALIERHIEVEDQLFDDLLERAKELSDDPLQVVLIWLKLLAEMIENMPNGHPGCIVATAVYQDRLFNHDVHEANHRAIIGWRIRFRNLFEEISVIYPPSDPIDLDHLSDMVSALIEGGIIMARATNEPQVPAQQIMLMRSYVKLLFSPRPQ